MYVRIRSHRAREKLKAALGRMPEAFYSLWFNGEFLLVTDAEYAKVKGIKGITRARIDETKLHKCWSLL